MPNKEPTTGKMSSQFSRPETFYTPGSKRWDTLKADIAQFPRLSSDTSSDESDEDTYLKSRLAQNQNQMLAQAFTQPRHSTDSFSSRCRMTESDPHTKHTERMNVRAELYQHSVLGLKGHISPNLTPEDINRISRTVMKTNLEGLEVQGIATSFESEFTEPLFAAIENSTVKHITLYAWLCTQVFICRNMAILVYSNFKRLQNANLAGEYISMIVSRRPSVFRMSPMVANLNRLEFSLVLDTVLAFTACIDAVRKQIASPFSLELGLEFLSDKLMEINRSCRNLLKNYTLDWSESGIPADNPVINGMGISVPLWHGALRVADLAILSYEGAHTTNFAQQILQKNCDVIELEMHDRISPIHGAPSEAQSVQSGEVLQLRRQKMKCLAEFLGDKDVWVFGRFSTQKMPSSYLSADIATFADVWGPVWKVKGNNPTTGKEMVARYNVGGGSIVPWPYDSAIHPHLEPCERLCHWLSNAASVRFKKAGSSNTGEKSVFKYKSILKKAGSSNTSENSSFKYRSILKKADSFAGLSSSYSDADEGEGEEVGSDLECFGDETRLMIGADASPQMKWKSCHCDIGNLVQRLKDAGRLDHIITSKPYRYVDSQQISLVGGSHGVQAGRAKTIKDKREENLKTSLLDRWVNEPHSRDPREFENLWGVVVSLCTMNARRVRLVELLGDDSVIALLRHFPWSDLSLDGSTSQVRDQYLKAVCSADPRSLGDLWDTYPPWREELGQAILSCLKILVLTGFNDKREEFYILWLPPGCRGPRRITLKSTDQTWVKFVKDTTYSVTVAVAVADSLTCKSHRRKCKHLRPTWFQSPSLLETAICINNSIEPTPRLVKVPSSLDLNNDSWGIDIREWRSIWDISALNIGVRLWVGSQTRVRVAGTASKWHLFLEVDTVRRQILREILGMKASEKMSHWEYTDVEAEAIDVRPIPVHIIS